MARLPVAINCVGDFLRLPDFKPPFEFVGGRVVQKVAKNLTRSLILGRLAEGLDAFARPRVLGRAFIGLRIVCGDSALVPELSFFGPGRVPKPVRGDEDFEVTSPPDIALEFVAPGQSEAEPLAKLRLLIDQGGRLGWMIDPALERVTILRPGWGLDRLAVDAVLGGEAVLPGFSISLDDLFGPPDRD